LLLYVFNSHAIKIIILLRTRQIQQSIRTQINTQGKYNTQTHNTLFVSLLVQEGWHNFQIHADMKKTIGIVLTGFYFVKSIRQCTISR